MIFAWLRETEISKKLKENIAQENTAKYIKMYDDTRELKKNIIQAITELEATYLVIEDKNLISTWSKYQIELLRWSKSLGFDIDWEYRYNPPPTKLTLRFNVLQYFKR
jgi:hypothetical protein